jgi:hypothetical protein
VQPRYDAVSGIFISDSRGVRGFYSPLYLPKTPGYLGGSFWYSVIMLAFFRAFAQESIFAQKSRFSPNDYQPSRTGSLCWPKMMSKTPDAHGDSLFGRKIAQTWDGYMAHAPSDLGLKAHAVQVSGFCCKKS